MVNVAINYWFKMRSIESHQELYNKMMKWTSLISRFFIISLTFQCDRYIIFFDEQLEINSGNYHFDSSVKLWNWFTNEHFKWNGNNVVKKKCMKQEIYWSCYRGSVRSRIKVAIVQNKKSIEKYNINFQINIEIYENCFENSAW